MKWELSAAFVLALLDFSAIFDTFDHGMLLDWLWGFGVELTVLLLFLPPGPVGVNRR